MGLAVGCLLLLRLDLVRHEVSRTTERLLWLLAVFFL